jgi:D-lactate dehydrogenase (cytochrome)
VRTVSEIMVRGLLPCAVEFMDYRCLELVGDLLPFPVPGGEASLLLIETDGTPEQTAAEIARIGEICREMGATDLLPAPSPEDRERVWNVRRQISLRVHDYAGIYLSEDVVVPIARIADLIDVLPDVERRYGVRVFSFGHAGDGNIHLNFTAPREEDREAMERGIREVLGRVLDMGGTMSGEHGIGITKQPFIEMELPEEVRQLQMGIKRVFDPNMILNPAKIFNWP